MGKAAADRARAAGLEAALAGVLRRSRLGIVVLAGDASVVWANDAALQTLPALDPARPGANLAGVVDVAAAGGDWARLTEALAKRTTLPAFELPVVNGRWLRVELQAFSSDLVADPRPAATLALQDVTLRRRARERERVEGELMRQTGQLGRIGAWEYDVASDTVRWSDETFAIHGLAPVAEPDKRTFIRLYDAKGGDGTAYFTPDQVLPFLDRYLVHRDKWIEPETVHTHYPLIVNPDGSPVTTRYIQRLVERLKAKVGIQGIVTPHVFRHTFATELLEDGFSIIEVQKLLRHANLATTEVYLHVRDEGLRGKMARRT